MKLPPLIQGTFIQRLNRFAALVEVQGRETLVHVANSGRMRELLQPGNPCYLAPAPGPGRKTAYDLALVDVGRLSHGAGAGLGSRPSIPTPGSGTTGKGKGQGRALVSADARLPGHLVFEALQEGRLTPFTGYPQARREVVFGESRLDLLLQGPPGRCLVEVKSVTLVERGLGLFPDAPTERGRRHVQTLAQAVAKGYRAAVLFVIQRPDAHACAPNDPADPAFGAALREAVAQGVEAHAYVCRVTRREVRIWKPVPVCLDLP